ncbi:uncharacterized protein DUF4062 [Trinickia symbiotica]|uniref:DUF4062 domain-containing protein n=1 Tax=Trinickia symbiotica TaxID=863227 RepID=A0A2N7WJQ9_9BURK|nr:DUF4062 domain-containing protein [Trinickia symbiotica]PMS29647.1 DUF4062 domain-containing protein [Trinickia symbiotica]PPK41045.1 uncharacterized protein DUF4062 [Trinickia symbiotica]
MDKKYQVFISSTYMDMKAERQAAVEAILDAGHIPAGMELFSASDKKQIEVIKGWIDRSDIFMLILGGRYGSVEPESGKSYIHLEYEHAVQTGKPFFALYLTDKAINGKVMSLGTDAIERNDTKKLNEFRDLVKSRLCSEIEDLKDIRIQVPKSIRELSAANKLEGWVRASEAPDLSPLLAQLGALHEENARLKAVVKEVGESPRVTNELAESTLDLPLSLEYELETRSIGGLATTDKRHWQGTYLQMFNTLGPRLLDEPADSSVRQYLARVLKEGTVNVIRARIVESSYQAMKMRLMALGAIDIRRSDGATYWSLTEAGKALLMKLHADEQSA